MTETNRRRLLAVDVELREVSDGLPPGIVGRVWGRLVPFNTPAQIGLGVREQFTAASFPNPDNVVGGAVTLDHNGVVGRIAAAEVREDGLYGALDVADTALGRDAMTLVRTRSLTGLSIEFMFNPKTDTWNASRSLVTRGPVRTNGVALTHMPAYTDARITAHRKETPMDPNLDDPTPPSGDPTPPPAPAGDFATRDEVAALRTRLAALSGGTPPAPATHPLAQYRSLGEYAHARYTGAEERALAEQLLDDNDGLQKPTWMTEIIGILARSRRVIGALAGPASAGETGMTLDYPFYDGDLSTLIAEQLNELDQVNSVTVSIKKGSNDLRTWAGGSKQSRQLLERGTQSYRDAYMRIMLAAFARISDVAFAAAIADAGVNTLTYLSPARFDAAVIAASLAVDDATGAAPDAVFVATDLFLALTDVRDNDDRPMFPYIGASNTNGTIGRAGLTLDIAGLPVIPSTGIPAGQAVVTNSIAARWHETGVNTVTADDVAHLGQDTAVYTFAAPAIYLPNGVQVIHAD